MKIPKEMSSEELMDWLNATTANDKLNFLACHMNIKDSAEIDTPPWLGKNDFLHEFSRYTAIRKNGKVLLTNTRIYYGTVNMAQETAEISSDIRFFCCGKSQWSSRFLIPSHEGTATVPLTSLMRGKLSRERCCKSENSMMVKNRESCEDMFAPYAFHSTMKECHDVLYFLDSSIAKPQYKAFYRTFSEALQTALAFPSSESFQIFEVSVLNGMLQGVLLVYGVNESFEIFAEAADALLIEERLQWSVLEQETLDSFHRDTGRPTLILSDMLTEEQRKDFFEYADRWINCQWTEFLSGKNIKVRRRKAPVRMFLTRFRNDMAYITPNAYGFQVSMPDIPEKNLLEPLLDEFCTHLMLQPKPVFLSWYWKMLLIK